MKQQLTSVWIHSVGRVVLRIQRVLQMELCELQHPLDHILHINGLGHVWGGHDVKGGQTGISRLGHPLHDEVPPQTLFVHGIIPLKIPGTVVKK